MYLLFVALYELFNLGLGMLRPNLKYFLFPLLRPRSITEKEIKFNHISTQKEVFSFTFVPIFIAPKYFSFCKKKFGQADIFWSVVVEETCKKNLGPNYHLLLLHLWSCATM